VGILQESLIPSNSALQPARHDGTCQDASDLKSGDETEEPLLQSAVWFRIDPAQKKEMLSQKYQG